MSKIKNKFKESFFIVNKIYLFIAFILLSIQSFGLGIIYFLATFFMFIWKTLSSKLPMEIDENIDFETVSYKTIEDRNLKIDIYYPKGRSDSNYPLVYFCHGGGWISGFRNQPNNISWCKYLASKGFVASSIDYRYGYKNTIEDLLSDYTDGLEFLKENASKFQIDKENISLMGLSAGAHLSLLYSTFNSHVDKKDKMEGVKSVVAYYPPSDLKDLFTEDSKSIFTRFAAASTMKGTPASEEEIYKKYSPINWLSKNMVPTLVAHGKADKIVPFESSVKLVKKLNQLKIKNKFLIHNNGPHSFDTKLNDYRTVDTVEKTVRFIKDSF